MTHHILLKSLLILIDIHQEDSYFVLYEPTTVQDRLAKRRFAYLLVYYQNTFTSEIFL